jgi:hypothetical protein
MVLVPQGGQEALRVGSNPASLAEGQKEKLKLSVHLDVSFGGKVRC